MNYYEQSANKAVNSMKNFELIKILEQDLESEYGAIEQYREHLKLIKDSSLIAKLEEIIQDELDHVNILTDVISKLRGE